jgi:acylphosphatase
MKARLLRARITYTGNVHGVGFRWTARDIANSLNLTGWVMNSPDGRVEVLCEGDENEIDVFIKKIGKAMEHYITSSDIIRQKPTGEFDSFGIKFYYK